MGQWNACGKYIGANTMSASCGCSPNFHAQPCCGHTWKTCGQLAASHGCRPHACCKSKSWHRQAASFKHMLRQKACTAAGCGASTMRPTQTWKRKLVSNIECLHQSARRDSAHQYAK